jgi:hypothetical protein
MSTTPGSPDELQPSTGVHYVEVDTRAGPTKHSEGWDAALQNALDNTGWPPGDRNAHVEFSVTARIKNPGIVLKYSVTLLPG